MKKLKAQKVGEVKAEKAAEGLLAQFDQLVNHQGTRVEHALEECGVKVTQDLDETPRPAVGIADPQGALPQAMCYADAPMGVPEFTAPALAGEHVPGVILQREHTHHRAICYMVAQGMSNVEVAEALGISPPTVAYTKKQPWASELIRDLQDQHGRRAVMGVLQGAALKAAKTIAALATADVRDSSIPQTVKGKMANALLDRLYGTAPQVVMHGQVDTTELSDEELLASIKQN